jgi:TonB family protein
MSAVLEFRQIPKTEPGPQLLVELPSWPRAFFGNLRDLVFPRRLPPLELRSAPAPFWHDVLVKRGLPWFSFLESGAYHLIACAIIIALTRFLALQPRVVPQPKFDHNQVIYYEPSEYLRPIDTRTQPDAKPAKADPEFARQPIISLPPEADNRSQTIVTPPNVKLKHDVAMPNIVAWSDKMEKPRLAIPPVPLTPAADLMRLAPKIENSVVAPPPDAAHLTRRSDQPNMQTTVVAPPPDIRTSRQAPAFEAPQPAVVAPPPVVANATRRQLGDLNIARSTVIAPAPQLPIAEQRSVAGGRSSAVSGIAPPVVPPPPSLSNSGSAGQSFGSPGRVIALNLHPAVGAPPAPPSGNRRGAFAATPEGRAGASGSPGTSSGAAAGTDGHGNAAGNGSSGKGKSDLPAGLYVGSPAAGATTSSVAASPSAAVPAGGPASPSPASVPTPPATSVPARPMSPDGTTKLSDAERSVFRGRRLYSLTMNMPNLNSSGGSWVIRFAELKQDSNSSPADLSQPAATRKVDPGYPSQLIRENVAGTVILYAVIRADGSVANVRVLNGVDDRLDDLAREAVQKWKFQPAMKNGSPIDVEATFQIPFRPPRGNF